MSVFDRYRLVPGARQKNGWGCESWLVAVDKKTNEVVREPGNSRKYLRFANSDEFLEWADKQKKTNIVDISLTLDLNTGTCTVRESGAEAVTGDIHTDSIETVAEEAGERIRDYIEGLD